MKKKSAANNSRSLKGYKIKFKIKNIYNIR